MGSSPFSADYPSVPITTRLERSAKQRRRLNQYYREEKIGTGRHGEVYLCRDTEANNRPVAMKVVRRSHPRDKIKLLRKTYQQSDGGRGLNSTENSIRKEIAVMKQCRHPNLVALFEVIDDPREERIYLIMDYMAGGTVQWQTSEYQPLLTLAQTRRIMRDVILGVEFMHSKNILHRDIKPSNIMYTADRSSVKLIDFGISHIITPTQTKHTSNKDPNLEALFPPSDLLKRVGTPTFMAPEMVWFSDDPETLTSNSYDTMPLNSLHNPSSTLVATSMPKTRPPITKAIDIWALGITFYCLLFGHTPFPGSLSENDNIHHNEFMLYHQICTQDWDAEKFMGSERIPTGGRHPTDHRSDGYLVVQLLEGMLQKDPVHRITLPSIKKNPFILRDVLNSKAWTKLTTPLSQSSDNPSFLKNGASKFFSACTCQ